MAGRKEDVKAEEDIGLEEEENVDGVKVVKDIGLLEEKELTQEQELLSAIKKAHDLAKAVKSDNAEVPKHLWDAAVCCGPPRTKQEH